MDGIEDDTVLAAVVDTVLDYNAEEHVATVTQADFAVSSHRRFLVKGSVGCRGVYASSMHSHCFMICMSMCMMSRLCLDLMYQEVMSEAERWKDQREKSDRPKIQRKSGEDKGRAETDFFHVIRGFFGVRRQGPTGVRTSRTANESR